MRHADALRAVGLEPPSRLEALLMYLAGGNPEIVDPSERRGVHPLLVPLARDDQGHVLAFLRWPTPPPNAPLPIVRQEGAQLRLLANSTDELLRRELATRDATPGEAPGALLEAANQAGTLYEPGELLRSGLPLKAFLLVKVGVTPEFFEELALAHLERGDEQAALITADRGCMGAPGWARPHAFRAQLLEQLGRIEEARDSARMALLEPVWTLGRPFEPVARLAGWRDPITSVSYRRLATDPDKPILDRAAHLMDAVAVEGGAWDDVRLQLAAMYAEAGLDEMARFVAG